MSAPGQSGYDDVRRRLVERGYLQGRVERFLLKDLVAPGSPARGVARTALKAAVLGAPILGALLAGAAVAGNRPLLGATDGLVLWLYFAIVSGLVLFLLDLVAAAIVVGIASRRGARRADTLRAGLLVALPTLAYLLLLWWNRKGGGLVENLAFLASAVVATGLIAWLAGLVSLAGIVGRTGQVPDRSRRAILFALLALPAAVFVLVPRAGAASADPAPFEPAPAPRLTVVGIDGLDGGLVEALAATEAVDGMLVAMQRGAVLPWKRPAGAPPPEMWTTLLSGMPPQVHGVRDAGAQRLPGVATPLRREGGPLALEAALRFLLPARDVPTTGASRRVRTAWEIVALKAPSSAVGFWTSWPASAPGYVVSDRVLAKLLSGAPGDRDTAPESLYERLRHEFPDDEREIRARFDAEIGPKVAEPLRPLVGESFLIDAYAWRVSERLAGDPSIRAAFVYLPGLDILRFRLGERREAPGSTAMVEAQRALEAYVRWLDALVVSAARGAGRTVVVADPGRAAGPGAEGFVIVAGEGVRASCVAPIAPLDLAPTLLALAGFPASEEMPGTASLSCVEGVAPPPRVATFGRRAPTLGGAASDYDPEMIERLRSLGYVR